jgi:hypothetical protein
MLILIGAVSFCVRMLAVRGPGHLFGCCGAVLIRSLRGQCQPWSAATAAPTVWARPGPGPGSRPMAARWVGPMPTLRPRAGTRRRSASSALSASGSAMAVGCRASNIAQTFSKGCGTSWPGRAGRCAAGDRRPGIHRCWPRGTPTSPDTATLAPADRRRNRSRARGGNCGCRRGDPGRAGLAQHLLVMRRGSLVYHRRTSMGEPC